MTNELNAVAATTEQAPAAKLYSWSTDEETYRDNCHSVEEAVAAAVDHHGSELQVGATVYIGEVLPVDCGRLLDAADVIDLLQTRAYDLVGESSEDWLVGVPKVQKARLESFIAGWVYDVEEPTFWQIGAVTTHVLTAADLGHACEGGQPECGPVEHYDSEGVPLCAVCWEGLLADTCSAEELNEAPGVNG